MISEKTYNLVNSCERQLKDIFDNIDNICEYNSLKVLNAFHKNNLSESHFNSTTGYGYNDSGRDVIEDIKNGKLPEDVEKNTIDNLQDVVNDYNKMVEELVKEKEKDLMEI